MKKNFDGIRNSVGDKLNTELKQIETEIENWISNIKEKAINLKEEHTKKLEETSRNIEKLGDFQKTLQQEKEVSEKLYKEAIKNEKDIIVEYESQKETLKKSLEMLKCLQKRRDEAMEELERANERAKRVREGLTKKLEIVDKNLKILYNATGVEIKLKNSPKKIILAFLFEVDSKVVKVTFNYVEKAGELTLESSKKLIDPANFLLWPLDKGKVRNFFISLRLEAYKAALNGSEDYPEEDSLVSSI